MNESQPSPLPSPPAGVPPAEPSGDRTARAAWLIEQLRRRAETCVDPVEQANLRRSADSLARLTTVVRR